MEYLKTIELVLREARTRVLDIVRGKDAFKVVGRNRFGDKTFLLDRLAEEAVVKALSQRLKRFTLLSEEAGILEVGGGGGIVAVLDPLDGSTNASRGFPFYSISLALAEGSRLSDVVAAGVVDVPRGDIYLAARGGGSRLNGRPIKVSDVKRLKDSVLGADVNVKGRAFGYLAKISPVLEEAYSVRFMGSNALGLCMVASGVYDAFVDFRGLLRVVDSAAGMLIVEEAGGVVLDQAGRRPDPKLEPGSRVSLVAASTMELASEIISLFRPKG
ncbi:hypothetical protein DRO57_07880 [Candidatus Bathyarchaeota archaeon]|nr:MAG: hypothetical protein DRO57_07880 [Candidatus Bathyarchaeota archaeon]